MSQDEFDLNCGISRKENGQSLVESHNNDFVLSMRGLAIAMSGKNGSVTSDDLRIYASQHCIYPKHPNAWGAIFRGEEWKSIGFTRSKLISNHARTIRVWKFIFPS